MSVESGKSPVHLWVFNHPLQGISDQIEFFFMVMRQNGHRVTMSRYPRNDSLNVVIENFSENSSQQLIDFCERSGKRVALIMTEHLDLVGSELFIHGDRLWGQNDYMHPATQVARIKNLLDCVPYLRAVLVLGDLPELAGSNRMFPGLAVRSLPFPQLEHANLPQDAPKHDFVFTGALTAFRESILNTVGGRYGLHHCSQFLPRAGRDRLNASARIVLSIPQRSGWRWLSLMRVIAALRCGRATVSIATQDVSYIARCTLQVGEADWEAKIGALLADWRGAYESTFERYETMRRDFLDQRGFPSDLFEYWGLLERASLGRSASVRFTQVMVG